jgi:oligopeptide transport system permease protein
MADLNIERIDQGKFVRVGKNLKESQAIKRESMSYLQDAMRRLKKNIPAVISFWILVFFVIMAIIGPIISNKLYGHTYKSQNLKDQNQTPIMTNARSIAMITNDVFEYDKYDSNFRKSKVIFRDVKFKSTGELAFKIGNEAEESWQGDKKEYEIRITVENTDTWSSVIRKLNDAGEKILKEDSDFRGITFEKKGGDLVIKTHGEKWFNKKYWLGTDEFGRDIWTRLWEGARVSFFIALTSVLFSVIIGIVYGGIAGYKGGKLDTLMMRIIEILMTVPDLLYIILLLTVMKPGLKPIIIVLSCTSWMGTARLIRGEVMRLKHSEYVMAAQALGADTKRIIFKHLIPNAMGPLLVNMTMMVPSMIFAEAFLSFIGLGMPAPFASWGVLANQGANVFRQFPHQLIIPAVVISLTMLSFNLLGDGLRDALDPRLRK